MAARQEEDPLPPLVAPTTSGGSITSALQATNGDERQPGRLISQADDRVEVSWDRALGVPKFSVPVAIALEWFKDMGRGEASDEPIQ